MYLVSLLTGHSIEKIIQQKLLYKEFQLKRFIGKYTEFIFNFEKNSQAEAYPLSQILHLTKLVRTLLKIS